MTGFYLKKLLGALLQPLPVITILLLLGVFFLIKRRYRMALAIQCSSVVLLILLSTPWATRPLLEPVEQQYRQFDLSTAVEYVVVLGCGHRNDGRLPVTAQLASCSLYRITEGIRIYRNNPGATLITSGYAGNEPFSNARTTMEVAIALGVPASDILIEERPKDTQEEARLLQAKLAGKSFALVTSASHMPRAIKYFENLGLQPIAAPTGHVIKDNSRDPVWKFFPSSKHLYKAERAVYEYLGQLWQWLRS